MPNSSHQMVFIFIWVKIALLYGAKIHSSMGQKDTPLWGKKTLLYGRKYQPLLGLKITNFPGFFEGGRIHLLYVVVLSSGFILLVMIFNYMLNTHLLFAKIRAIHSNMS
jgi:hypothetical protein